MCDNSVRLVCVMCKQIILYDNTEKIRRFAIYEGGSLVTISDDVPQWYVNSLLFENGKNRQTNEPEGVF